MTSTYPQPVVATWRIRITMNISIFIWLQKSGFYIQIAQFKYNRLCCADRYRPCVDVTVWIVVWVVWWRHYAVVDVISTHIWLWIVKSASTLFTMRAHLTQTSVFFFLLYLNPKPAAYHWLGSWGFCLVQHMTAHWCRCPTNRRYCQTSQSPCSANQ